MTEYTMPTHASTQQKKRKLAVFPTMGIYIRQNEITTDVQIITARYADVASEVRMPV